MRPISIPSNLENLFLRYPPSKVVVDPFRLVSASIIFLRLLEAFYLSSVRPEYDIIKGGRECVISISTYITEIRDGI
jgi:hypothetical protein